MSSPLYECISVPNGSFNTPRTPVRNHRVQTSQECWTVYSPFSVLGARWFLLQFFKVFSGVVDVD